MYVVVTSVVTLFVLIFLGFFIGKRNVVNKEVTPQLSNLVLDVTMPATVFCSIVAQSGSEMVASGATVLVSILCLHVIMFIIGLIGVKIFRPKSDEKGIWLYTCLLSNNGFMGFPLAYSIFGSIGMFYMAICNIATNAIIFSIGVKLLTDGQKTNYKMSIRKVVFNNINIAVIAGLFFSLLNIPIPEMIDGILGYVSNITSGLSMIVVGLSLSRLPLKAVFSDKKMFGLTFLRLILIPIVAILLLKYLPIDIDATAKGVLILTAALPASAAQSMITEQYNANTAAAGRSVFITTLFSVVTVPLIMLIGL